MMTIISGTNRRDSETEKIAQFIFRMVQATGYPVKLLRLTDLPNNFISNDMYKEQGQAASIGKIQDEFMLAADKFWFVFPEYNGGIPGMLKLFLDAISVRAYKATFHGKKACLTGISTGRAGNLRGLDQLTNILNYLQVIVHPNKVPISSISRLKNAKGEINDPDTLKVLNQQMEAFIAF